MILIFEHTQHDPKRTFCHVRTAKTKAIKPGIFSLLTVLGKWPVNVPYALILDQYHLKPLAEAIWACKISNLVSSWQNMPMTQSKMSYTYVTDLSENANFSSKLSIVWNVIWLEPGILFHQLFGYWVTKGSLFRQKLQRECQQDPKLANKMAKIWPKL